MATVVRRSIGAILDTLLEEYGRQEMKSATSANSHGAPNNPGGRSDPAASQEYPWKLSLEMGRGLGRRYQVPLRVVEVDQRVFGKDAFAPLKMQMECRWAPAMQASA